MSDDFNINNVIRKIASNSNIDDKRRIYLEEIMDWTDNYTENYMCNEDLVNESKMAKSAIENLWVNYCNMEVSLQQYKKVAQIYDNALQDPIAKTIGGIYKSYAEFNKGRNKVGKAQKVYIQGLCAGLSQVDIDSLWFDLLQLLKSQDSQSQDLTMQTLYDAVRQEISSSNVDGHDINNLIAPSELSTESNDSIVNNIEIGLTLSQTQNLESNHFPNLSLLDEITTLSTNEDIKAITLNGNSFAETYLDDLKGMTPEILRRIHHKRPPMLFVAPDKEPMIKGIKALKIGEINMLETYLGHAIHDLSTDNDDGISNRYHKVINVIEGLWIQQALKERHFDSWFADLKKIQAGEEKDIRYFYAGVNVNAMQQNERNNIQTDIKKLQMRFHVQIELLHAIVNRNMYLLLLSQLKILGEFNFPSFNVDIINSLESCTNKSLYSKKSNEFDEAIYIAIANLQRFVCTLLSKRIKIYTSANTNNGVNAVDYYSIEAKSTRRKKKRIDDTTIDSFLQSYIDGNGELMFED